MRSEAGRQRKCEIYGDPRVVKILKLSKPSTHDNHAQNLLRQSAFEFTEKALRRDPPALVVADRRALAAFRACSELGLRCVVNSAGLLGDLDRPPNSIPAPYTGRSCLLACMYTQARSLAWRVVHTLSFFVRACKNLRVSRTRK